MLIAGPTSVCDVCLEAFGRDGKAPCSISCGHVFCVDCLDHITRPSCPLCRTYFESRSTVKLVVDLDNIRPSPRPNAAVTANDEENARRLYSAIASIADEGCSESQVRQLISEGKTFLQKHSRDTFKDLRTLHRMVAYLCEVKTNLRAQNQASETLKQEMAQLQSEKAELTQKIEQQLTIRAEEKQQALAVEMSLRDHCSQAHSAYQTMVDQYNYVAKEWMRLNEEVKQLRMPATPPHVQDGLERKHYVPTTAISRDPSPYLDQVQLKGAALQSSESILISPLPQFTGRFDTMASCFLPLPDVEEEETEEEEDDDEDERALEKPTMHAQGKPDFHQHSNCDAVGHPYSCNCQGFTIFPNGAARAKQAAESGSSTRSSSFDRSAKQSISDRPAPTVLSGLSRTAPYLETRRPRSHSIPSETSSRSQSSSRAPSRSTSPVHSPLLPPRPPLRHSPPSHDVHPQSSHQNIPQHRENDGLRSRLQNILTDTSVSSSLPNMSAAHFPASFASKDNRPTRNEHRRSPSRSPSPPPPPPEASNLQRRSSQVKQQQQSQSTTEQFSKLLASHPTIVPVGSTSSTSPNPRTSSASDAARAIEQGKRERYQADKEHDRNRRKGEKERKDTERESERSRTSSTSQTSVHRERERERDSNRDHPPATSHMSSSGSGMTSSRGPTFASSNSTKAASSTSNSALHRETSQSQVPYHPRYPSAANGKGLAPSLLSASNPTGIYA